MKLTKSDYEFYIGGDLSKTSLYKSIWLGWLLIVFVWDGGLPRDVDWGWYGPRIIK